MPEDYDAMSDSALATALTHARRGWLTGRDQTGRLAAYLHDTRDWSWQRIADLTGVDVTTARRWALPYMEQPD